MSNKYFEEPLSYEQFIKIVREARGRLIKGLMERVSLYTELECCLSGNILILGETAVEVCESIVEADCHRESGTIPPVELSLSSERMDKEIGLGFYYNSRLEVHSLTILCETGAYSRLKDFIYNSRYTYAEFLLKNLKDEYFTSLLVDELFFQLFWSIPELNYHLAQSSPALCRKSAGKAVKVKRFADLFYGRGFTVNDGRLFCSLKECEVRPRAGRLLSVKVDEQRDISALYDRDKRVFRQAESSAIIERVLYWRYAEMAEMKRLLAEQELSWGRAERGRKVQ